MLSVPKPARVLPQKLLSDEIAQSMLGFQRKKGKQVYTGVAGIMLLLLCERASSFFPVVNKGPPVSFQRNCALLFVPFLYKVKSSHTMSCQQAKV